LSVALCVYLQDPFPKPCYLFALVAGDLVMKEDSFTTISGRKVVLRIYTQPANITQVGIAPGCQQGSRSAQSSSVGC
jgi:aminopeptidase N